MNIFTRLFRPPIIAGPWLGEFGWEIMRWQGVFRALAEKGHRITMVSRTGHEVFYEDYVDSFIPALELGFVEIGATDGWRIDGAMPVLSVELLRDRFPGYIYRKPDYCMKRGVNLHSREQRFVSLGRKPHAPSNEVIVHARWTNKANSAERNWPIEKWEEAITQIRHLGFSVTAIGSPHAAACPGGASDARGLELRGLVDRIAAARLVMGPSSGPMHLASLCKTPHLVWTDREFWGSTNGTNRHRYEEAWNPLHTPAYVIDEEDWQPSVATVMKSVQMALKLDAK